MEMSFWDSFTMFYKIMFDHTFIIMISLISFGLILTDNSLPKARHDWKTALLLVAKFAGSWASLLLLHNLAFVLNSMIRVSMLASLLQLLASCIVTIAYEFLFAKKKNFRANIMDMLFLICVLIALEKVSETGGRYIGGFTDVTFLIVIARSCPYILFVLFTLMMRKFPLDGVENLPGIYCIIPTAVGIAIVVITLLFATNQWDSQNVYLLFVVIFSTFAVLVFILYMTTQSSIINLEAAVFRHVYEELSDADLKMVEMSNKNKQDLRAIRHELKNQYAIMSNLIDEGKYEELKSYFNEIQVNNQKALSFIDCGNKTVSLIMNIELTKASAHSIKVVHNIVIPPSLPYSKADLASLLSNIMDNAIEALIRDNTPDPKIEISIMTIGEYLRVVCRNHTNQEKVSLISSKNSQEHGFGSKIITEICRKYDGKVKFFIEDHNFICDCLLSLDVKGEGAGEQEVLNA